ncbi:hypothetical protein [Alkalihalobacillus trypoxylicola]|uniref:Spore coat protein n=1 Tax=Alkalihalobacillus trypoxylicola TaxID=519424 RepID=A0A162EEP8_9BACI|nr:hypothetical protein [Alkalihalobacillus trypoxylicola]KYG32399.1 hypothetical protein AZF04_06460 [Alkalihalobacillus trypoxylicola]GAF66888.1 hypothetical protein BTS2_3793 [Bacillus sp. TS-2]
MSCSNYGRCNSYGGNRGSNRGNCDCDTFFRHVSKNQFVRVFLKASKHVDGFFIEANGNEATLFDFNERCHSVITICCDDIVAVEVSHANNDNRCHDHKKHH